MRILSTLSQILCFSSQSAARSPRETLTGPRSLLRPAPSLYGGHTFFHPTLSLSSDYCPNRSVKSPGLFTCERYVPTHPEMAFQL